MTADDAQLQQVAFDPTAWIEAQVAFYGPIASADTLKALLGCRTLSALNHALAVGEFGFATFTLPKRRGQFAFTCEVAAWLVARREKGASRAKPGPRGAADGRRAQASRGRADSSLAPKKENLDNSTPC